MTLTLLLIFLETGEALLTELLQEAAGGLLLLRGQWRPGHVAYRSISVSPTLLRYKQQVREQLASESGAALMKRRGVEVESVFGHIKEDRRFRRFLLRGLDKVRTEWGFLSIAHNLLKQTALQG